MDLEWVRQLISVVQNVVNFVSNTLPAGLGVIVVGAFIFLAALGIKRVAF